MKKDNVVKELNKLNLLTLFGATVIGNVVVGYFIGKWLDKIFEKDKLFVIIFLFFGSISGIYNAIRQLLKEVEKVDKNERRKNS